MKVYIASLYSRRLEMVKHKKELEAAGHEVTARWVDGAEEGRDEQANALMDVEDVERAECVVSFTQPKGSLFKGGGRHTELGIGLALNKLLFIIGEREQIFHWHPRIIQRDNLDEVIKALA